MIRMLLPIFPILVACTPSPQKAAMPSPNAAPELPKDSPAAAEGRRILSTAFVRVGPDGHLTVELRDGRVIVLRNVVMGRKDYCGAHVGGEAARTEYCGGYADVAAARPGGGPKADRPDMATPTPVEPRGSMKRK